LAHQGRAPGRATVTRSPPGLGWHHPP